MCSDGGTLLSECPGLALRLHRRDRHRGLDGRIDLDSWRRDLVQGCLTDLAGGVLVQVLEDVVLRVPDGLLPNREFEYFCTSSQPSEFE